MSDFIGTGAASLQSGIVVAAVIVAVLLVERLGGIEGLALKITQVALAVAITLTVFSGTDAFFATPDAPEGGLTGFSDSQDSEEQFEAFLNESAERQSEKGSLHLGIGIAFAVAGAALLRRLRALPASLLLGGILLLLLGATIDSGSGSFDSLSLIYAPLLQYAQDAGQTRDIVRFVVLLAGTALLLGFLVARWEVPPDEHEPAVRPEEPPDFSGPEALPPEPVGTP